MPKTQHSNRVLTALSLQVNVNVATGEAHILPRGNFAPDDGRDLAFEQYLVNDKTAAAVIARFDAKKNDTVIDYHHQTLFAEFSGVNALAAGWFSTLEYRADGWWATGIKWNSKAKDFIKDDEYRYTSAVFLHDAKTGEILEFINFTLTNNPAIDGLDQLAALSTNYTTQNQAKPTGETDMSATELAALGAQVTALTNERDKANNKVTALTTERDAANTKVAALEKEKIDAAKTAEESEKDALITTALADGRLAPAQKDWAKEDTTLASLTKFLSSAGKQIDTEQQGGREDGGGADENGLTQADLAYCSRMDVDPKDFAASKAIKAKQAAQR